jgi:hypothetical protein
MPRPTVLLKRSLIFIHRWLGVALSLIFSLWFVSGIVMMYWSFPGVEVRDRLERAPVLDPAQIKLSPEEAWTTLQRDQAPTQVRLTTFDGRPIYRFSGGGGRGGRSGGRGGRGGGGTAAVYADDGSEQTAVDDAMIDRAAVAWTKQPLSTAKKESVEEVDQWTVASQLRNVRPLFKYSFADGQQVYISGRDGEVGQYTTSKSRFWAYLGAIPHWLYFTPLRKHSPEWFKTVVWASGIGTISAILGIVIGLWMYSPSKRYQHAGAATSIPYKGQKRWHTILGLFFGVIAVTWAFSGLLSMGPFDFVENLTAKRPAEKGQAEARGGGGSGDFNPATVLRGAGRFQLASYADKHPRDAIASVAGGFQTKELDFTMFASEPVYMALDSTGATRIIPINGDPKTEFDPTKIIDMLQKAGGADLAELRMMDQYDAYYLDRDRQRPLPVIYVRMNDENQTRYYIDPKTGRVVGNYDSSDWVNRWLYHGLHSMDFPWLYNHRPLWDIVVITLMLGGTSLCVTSIILTWRVLRRKLEKVLPGPERSQTSDDLAVEA